MENLINDFVRGLIILAFIGGIHGLTKVTREKAINAHKKGLMNYSSYTKLLFDPTESK